MRRVNDQAGFTHNDPANIIGFIPADGIEEESVDTRLAIMQWLTVDEVAERYPDEYTDWIAGRDVSRRGGETREQVAARALEAFTEIDDDVHLAVIVTHSATAMALCAALLGLPPRDPVLAPLANCHWSELRHGSRWELRAHNVGAPGPVIPRLDLEEDAADAEA